MRFGVMRRTAALLILGAILSAGCASGPPVGSEAPHFNSRDTEGETISRDSCRGSVTLLYFWATWCAPCKRSGPAIQRLHERYGKNPHVTIAGVHYDRNDRLDEYIEEHDYSFRIVPDGSAISRAFNIKKIPEFVIIGREGRILFNQIGYGPGDEEAMAALIEKELKP